MATQFTDFTNASRHQDQFGGISDLLPNVLAGYKGAREPMRMAQEEEKLRLANELAGTKNQYAGRQEEADLELKLAQALHARRQAANPGGGSLTTTQKELADIYGKDSPEYKAALLRQYGIIEGADVPAGAVPLDTMSPGERNEATKRMRNELTRANDLSKAHKTLEEMQKIMEKHPGMADFFSVALVDPSAKQSFWGQLKRQGVNKEDLAAVEKFNKLSNDLILSAGQAMGAKAFTDAKLKVIEQAKPNARNTDEANRFVINYMKEDFEPYVGYGKALQHGLKNRYEVLEDPENYRPKKQQQQLSNSIQQMPQESQPMQQQQQQMPMQQQGGGQGQTVPMFKNGKKYNIPADKIQQALSAGFTNG